LQAAAPGEKARICKAVSGMWEHDVSPERGMWGHGLKQRETRGIKIQPKMAEFCGFFKVLDATPAGVLVPEEGP
jgi:hypothetical protein